MAIQLSHNIDTVNSSIGLLTINPSIAVQTALSINNIDIGSGLQNAYNTANGAFAKANTLPGAQQTTYISSSSNPGLTVNTGVNITLSGNNTLILGANAATTSAVGVVQLNDTTTSVSTTQVGTANSVNTAMTYAQGAFGVANSGQNLALSAFAEANSFQSVINTSFTTANSGQNLALSAFAEANSFQSVINTSFTTANSGQNLALSAYAEANTVTNIINPGNAVIVLGSSANSRGMMTQIAYANGDFANTGDAQWSTFLLRNQSTSSANTYTLSLNGANSTTNIYSSINQIILGSNNYLYAFSGIIGARDANNWSKVWAIQGAIKRGSGQSTTAYVGTPVISILAADNATNNWTISLGTDTTNAAILIQATGSTNTTNWVSRVDIVEIG